APPPGETLATVEFIGTGGADEIFNLVDGVNIRDFYKGSYANTINGTTTQNAFTFANIVGGASSNNVANGLYGTYVVDEQNFPLSSAFANQTLTEIKVTAVGASGQPLLLGM